MQNYLPEDLEFAKSLLSKLIYSNKKVSSLSSPLGIILGGQPASGKTALIRLILQEIHPDEDFIIINGDEFRSYHPDYLNFMQNFDRNAQDYTQSFSNSLVDYFLKSTVEQQRYNVIVEGTMRNYGTVEKTAALFFKNGYTVEAHILAVPEMDSLLGIFSRYEEEKRLSGFGRFSSPKIHEEAFKNLPANVQKLSDSVFMDRISIYTRSVNEEIRVVESSELMDEINWEDTINKCREYASYQEYLTQWQKIENHALERNETDEEYLNEIAVHLAYLKTTF